MIRHLTPRPARRDYDLLAMGISPYHKGLFQRATVLLAHDMHVSKVQDTVNQSTQQGKIVCIQYYS
jgi:hypothetical protein